MACAGAQVQRWRSLHSLTISSSSTAATEQGRVPGPKVCPRGSLQLLCQLLIHVWVTSQDRGHPHGGRVRNPEWEPGLSFAWFKINQTSYKKSCEPLWAFIPIHKTGVEMPAPLWRSVRTQTLQLLNHSDLFPSSPSERLAWSCTLRTLASPPEVSGVTK